MKLETKELQELYDELTSAPLTFSAYEESPVERAFKKCDELLQKHAGYDYLKKLQDCNDILEKSNKALLSANIDLAREKGKLERDLDTANNQVKYFNQSRDNWRSRAKHEVEEAEKKHQELKEELDKLQQDHESDVRVIGKLHSQMVILEDENTEQEKRADILKSQRDEALVDNLRLNKELDDVKLQLQQEIETLRKDRDILVRNNDEKQAEIAELKKELDELLIRAHNAEDNVEHLKKEATAAWKEYHDLLNNFYGVNSNKHIQRLQDSVREIGYEQGQTDLWDMLQNVNDSQPFELVTCFPDVTGMEDILNLDLEDFLDSYKKWQEQKEKKRLDACNAFYDGLKAGLASEVKEVPVSCDIPIKDLSSWECTIEATVEVNKDLLEKVCGVVPVEEEHKLEYGDAVRVPWRDYDYMYIGPKDGCICLFNPKSHYVTPVSSTKRLKYQGYKFFVTDEDDLRKIWNYKK